MFEPWSLYQPEPWYLQWWFLLPASAAVLGGLMGRLANGLSGSWMGDVLAWYLTTAKVLGFWMLWVTLVVAVYLFFPLQVMASLIWKVWRRKREADSWGVHPDLATQAARWKIEARPFA